MPPLLPPRRVRQPAGRNEALRRFVQGDLASLRVVFGLALIWAIFQFQNDRFLSAENLTNLMLQITAVGLISIGVVFVLLLGEIDLSVGAVSGLAAAVVAVLNVKNGWNPYLAIAAGVLVGMAIGLLQGALFSRFGVPSFVVTLAGLLAWQGALLQVLGSTGSINITDPKITGLANTFYSDAVGWVFAVVVDRPPTPPSSSSAIGGVSPPGWPARACCRSWRRSPWSRRSSSSRSPSSTPIAACRWPC